MPEDQTQPWKMKVAARRCSYRRSDLSMGPTETGARQSLRELL